jgi:hypothetical protein
MTFVIIFKGGSVSQRCAFLPSRYGKRPLVGVFDQILKMMRGYAWKFEKPSGNLPSLSKKVLNAFFELRAYSSVG